MLTEKKKLANHEDRDYFKDYSDIFSILKINQDQMKHEWNKEGDFIKEFDLFEDHPKPIITTYTHSIH